jgi:phosphoribosylformylglycinamidine synthase subunit PurQ / glutaminase
MPRPTRGETSSQIVLAARELRQRPTPAEDKLWEALRGRRLAGLKFRRQHPFGPFVLDMFCVEHQLVIEVDGSIHRKPEQTIYDAARTEYLMERGLHLLRFTNDEVEHHLPKVLNRILQNIVS